MRPRQFATSDELRQVLGLEDDEQLELDGFGEIRTHDGAWRPCGKRWRFHKNSEDLSILIVGGE